MSRVLQLIDDDAVLLVEASGPGAIKATVSIGPPIGSAPMYWDKVRLTRGDVRTLIAFLEALGDD